MSAMPDEEGYYVATYHQKYRHPDAKPPEREVVKVFRYTPGSSLLVTRHGYARTYQPEYFIFHSRVEVEVVS